MSIIPSENFWALNSEYKLLRLLHHRNKNQHRSTRWWRHFNTLKRSLTKLIALLQVKKLKPQHRDKIIETSMYIKCVVIKQCFRSFNEVIALAQFVSLGLALIGMLGKINSEIGFIEGLDMAIIKRKEKGAYRINSLKNKNESMVDIAEELGEEIGEDIGSVEIKRDEIIKEALKKRNISTLLDANNERKKKKKSIEAPISDSKVTKDKKKKKKKKSAIDDIFGF